MQTDTTPPLAPWIQRQVSQLLTQRGHAWLLQGPSGMGQYAAALALASAWLCENPSPAGACGHCASCHAIEVRTHADLCMLMPETALLELGWPLHEKAQAEIDDKKRKASKEIRVDAMRDAVEFAQRTSARGRGKVVVVFPAEDMNAITANALLKTLEEPPGDVRFVLATQSAHQLLPTIRSRCIAHALHWPTQEEASSWLQAQGANTADVPALLRAAGGRPDEALYFLATGRDPSRWAGFPAAMAQGDVSYVKDWSAVHLVDALTKLCHDLMASAVGAAPRFFDAAQLPRKQPPVAALSRWSGALRQTMKTVEHPWNAGLMLEALVAQAQSALNSVH